MKTMTILLKTQLKTEYLKLKSQFQIPFLLMKARRMVLILNLNIKLFQEGIYLIHYKILMKIKMCSLNLEDHFISILKRNL